MTNEETIDALVKAGDEATGGEWVFEAENDHGGTYNITGGLGDLCICDDEYYPVAPDKEDADFITQAANARPAIKAMLDENKAFDETTQYLNRKVAELAGENQKQREDTIEAQKMLFNQAKTIQKQREVIEVMREALEHSTSKLDFTSYYSQIEENAKAIYRADEILNRNT